MSSTNDQKYSPDFQLLNENKRVGEEADKTKEEITFSTFIFSLSTSALVYLGEIEEPETKKMVVNLDLAKQNIDILGILEEKTKGNLDENEERLFKALLYDLRLKYLTKVEAK